ncbi:hypothetical protein AC520_3290 [Enterobacter sp. OLF]|nr:hypothetical protein AC520_3290 [Enterobacter sp. OLF]
MRKRELSNILYSSLTCFNLSEFGPKKSPRKKIFRGLYHAFMHHWKIQTSSSTHRLKD